MQIERDKILSGIHIFDQDQRYLNIDPRIYDRKFSTPFHDLYDFEIVLKTLVANAIYSPPALVFDSEISDQRTARPRFCGTA